MINRIWIGAYFIRSSHINHIDPINPINPNKVRKNTKRTFRYYWNHIKRFKILAAIAVCSMMIVIALDLIIPYLYKTFFDALAGSKDPIATSDVLIKIIVLIALAHVGINIFRRLGDFMNIPLQSRVMGNIYYECFQYLHKHSYDFFNNNFTGSLVKKVNRMVSSLEGITDKFYYELMPLFIKIIVIFIVLLWIQPIIGIIMLVWTLIFMISNYFFISYKWKFDIDRAQADTRITGVLADTITNNANVRLFASLGFESKRFSEVINDWGIKMRTAWRLDTYASTVQGFAMILLEFLIFYFAITFWAKGMLTIGDFVWIQAYLIGLFIQLWSFGRTIRELYRRMADAEEMIIVLHTKHKVYNVPNAKNISIVRGKIEFKHVSFAYQKDDSLIRDLNLKIKPGEKIALIGPSGGGKTTITKLLLRFFDIQKGKILIDGQNIKKVTQESLRSQISFVPQDPILFHRTLMENIQYGRKEASKEEIIAASKLANCHDFIMSFTKKYNTYVGERGVKLSGGERQRVAIARAILANAPILVLDEATSSLDSQSEMLIQEALQNLMKYKTTLIIAHRLSTIMKMDRILVLQDGQIVEEGTHADLLSHKTGLYKKMWNLQVGGYVEE